MKSFPKIIVDSGESEYVMCDERFLTGMEEITSFTVELGNGMSVTARNWGIAELQVRGSQTVFLQSLLQNRD